MNLCATLGTLLLGVLSWNPTDISQFWVEPDKPAAFDFELRQDGVSDVKSDSDKTKFVVKTTDGELLKEGEGLVADNRLHIETVLPQGFFELELPDNNQAFGVASQPAFCPEDALLASEAKKRDDLRPRDDFFAIDSASTWLVRDDDVREALIRNARRIGIATYRERLSWTRIEPQKGAFNYEGDNNCETVRKAAKKYDMPILELFHNAPDWTGYVGKFPADLMKTADSWGKIGKRWNPAWNSFEVWNEPDISFSGNMPADQYVPVLKTVAQEFSRQGVKTPIVGGIIAVYRSDYMDSLADNGALDACDIFSFHTYCRAPEMAAVCMRYHEWTVKNNAEWKPLWITECGRPWKKGTDRPNREADLLSAIDIVEKGVVAKAIGCDAYFPFVYVYYEENDNNFGMSDRNNAPLRSIAGYARMIYLLSGKDCVGSWDIAGPESSWLFVDSKTGEQTAVLYSSQREPGRTLQLPCVPAFVERVTGERVAVTETQTVDFTDGLLFVGLPKDADLNLRSPSEVDNARNTRLEARKTHGAAPRQNFETVLRFDFDSDVVTASNDGYALVDANAVGEFHGVLSIFNFSDEEKTLPLTAEAVIVKDDGTRESIDLFTELPESVTVAARGVATAPFALDLSKVSPSYSPILTFKGGEDGVLSFRFSRGYTGENFAEFAELLVPVDLSNTSSWIKGCSAGGQIDYISGLQKDDSKGWGFKVKFEGDGDRWAYPRFNLPVADGVLKTPSGESVKMNEFKGVAFRVKATSNAQGGVVRLFTYSEKGNYYFTGGELAPADGKERFVAIPFRSLDAYGGTPDVFSADKILAISVGLNSVGDEATVEVGDLYFFK